MAQEQAEWLTLEDAAAQLDLTKPGVSYRKYEKRPMEDGTRRTEVLVPLDDLRTGRRRQPSHAAFSKTFSRSFTNELLNDDQRSSKRVELRPDTLAREVRVVSDEVANLREAISELAQRLSQTEAAMTHANDSLRAAVEVIDRQGQRHAVEQLASRVDPSLDEDSRAMLQSLIGKLPRVGGA